MPPAFVALGATAPLRAVLSAVAISWESPYAVCLQEPNCVEGCMMSTAYPMVNENQRITEVDSSRAPRRLLGVSPPARITCCTDLSAMHRREAAEAAVPMAIGRHSEHGPQMKRRGSA